MGLPTPDLHPATEVQQLCSVVRFTHALGPDPRPTELCFVPVSHRMVLHRLCFTEGLSLRCRTPPCECCVPLGLEHSKVHRLMWVSGEPDRISPVGSAFPMGSDPASAVCSLHFPLGRLLHAGSLLRTLAGWSGVPSSSLLGCQPQLEQGHHEPGLLPLPCSSHLQDAARAFPQQHRSPLAQERHVLSLVFPLPSSVLWNWFGG